MKTREFVVATYNIENLNNDNVAARTPILSAMIDRISADVILMQEVVSIDALKNLLKKVKRKKYNMVFSESEHGKNYGPQKLVVLIEKKLKFEAFEDATLKRQYHHNKVTDFHWKMITEEKAEPVSPDDSAESVPAEEPLKKLTWPKPLLHCQVNLGKQTLQVMNLHLKSKVPTDIEGQKDETHRWKWKSHQGWGEGYFLSSVRRVGQALETRMNIEDLFGDAPEDKKIVVGGDFNADIGTVPFKIIEGSVEETGNEKLIPTMLVPCEYNVPPEQRYSLLHRGKGLMLDHIMVSQALYNYWKGTSIYNELVMDESMAFATDIKFPQSDHAPIIATFNLPEVWFT